MRLAGAISGVFVAGCVLLIAGNACTTFGEDGADAGASEAQAGSDAATEAAPDGTIPEGSSLDGPAAAIECGKVVCTGGLRCCMGAGEPSCAGVCPKATWTMECTRPVDCARGACCWNTDGPTTTCEATCVDSYTLCSGNSDCPGSTCQRASCGGQVDFRVCKKTTSAFVDFNDNTPVCQPP